MRINSVMFLSLIWQFNLHTYTSWRAVFHFLWTPLVHMIFKENTKILCTDDFLAVQNLRVDLVLVSKFLFSAKGSSVIVSGQMIMRLCATKMTPCPVLVFVLPPESSGPLVVNFHRFSFPSPGLLGGRFGYFFFFSVPGRGRGSPERQGGRGVGFLLKAPGGGEVSQEGVGGGEAAGRVSAGNLGEWGGGGKNIFFRGRSARQDLVAPYRAILRYYLCDTPYRAILFKGGLAPPQIGAIPPPFALSFTKGTHCAIPRFATYRAVICAMPHKTKDQETRRGPEIHG